MTNATDGKRKREDHDRVEPPRLSMRWKGDICFTQIPATVEGVLSTFDQCVSNAVSQASESVRDTIIPMVQEVVDKEFNQLKEAVGKITELRVQNERLMTDIALKNGLTYDLENLVKSDQEVIQKAVTEISSLKEAVLVSENVRMDLQNKLHAEKQRSETIRKQAEASAAERDEAMGTLAKALAQSDYWVSEVNRLQNQNTDLQTSLEKASIELLTEQRRSGKLAANAKKSEKKLIGLQSNMAHIQSMLTQALDQ